MEPSDFAAIVAHLKGAPLSSLIILLSLPQPANEQVLSLYSGYCVRSVKEGLQHLLLLDLVEYCPENSVWRPSSKAMAFVQNLTAAGASMTKHEVRSNKNPQTGKFFFSPASSRSSLLTPVTEKENKLPLQQPQPPSNVSRKREKRKSKIPDELNTQQAYLLLIRTGIPPYLAEDAILAVVEAGWSGEKILDVVNGWMDYAGTEQGKTIQQPGFLIANRLKGLQEPPELDQLIFKPARDPKRFTKGKYGHLIKH